LVVVAVVEIAMVVAVVLADTLKALQVSRLEQVTVSL
jgi:hypothetical protein